MINEFYISHNLCASHNPIFICEWLSPNCTSLIISTDIVKIALTFDKDFGF